jgi:hypothetical protein
MRNNAKEFGLVGSCRNRGWVVLKSYGWQGFWQFRASSIPQLPWPRGVKTFGSDLRVYFDFVP